MSGYFNGRISMDTITEAVTGDAVAINKVVDFYSAYIEALARVKVKDENGTEYVIVDDDIRRRLETRLIASIVRFKPKK